MIYKNSAKILEEIKKAKRILINCHRSPDPDSIASAVSMYQALIKLGRSDITVISPDEVPANCKFLPESDKIIVTDFEKFDFKNFDTFIILDSGNWNQITGEKNILSSKINKIVIDHHYTNNNYGDANLIDENAGSCALVLYNLFSDWELKISPEIATSLLTGIIADTLSFQTDIIGDTGYNVADKLIKAGADRRKIIFNLYMSKHIDEIRLMGKMLANVEVDSEGKFAWVAISKEEAKAFPESQDAKGFVAGSFIQSIEGTNFGFVLEEFNSFCSVSFRSRTDFDVSKIAEKLGGGGHKSAAAARILLPFDQAVIKVLEIARKYANKN